MHAITPDDPAQIAASAGHWNLTGKHKLYSWQQEALERWSTKCSRGIIKVVTGGGKTMLGLAAAERLQREVDTDLRVAIIVPSVVLAQQWHALLREESNLPSSEIGILGGGHDASFTKGVRILIAVLNSASLKLPSMVRAARIGEHLLMIVDECHRAGSAERRSIFETPRKYSLGLSATPEREDADTKDAMTDYGIESGDAVLTRELGEIVYSLNYAEAIAMGVLAPFCIEHYGLALDDSERQRYEGLSRDIVDLRRELEGRNRRGTALLKWCRSAMGQKNPRAQQFLALTTERKALLYKMKARLAAVEVMVQSALTADPLARIIIFHESIAEVEAIASGLLRLGLPVVMEHSERAAASRTEAIDRFRSGEAQIIVSAKSLIEGFNVPSADIGIIVAASSSVRQRIQTLGRLLRKGDNPNKFARLIVFYAAKTVDEVIYEKADWETFVGKGRNAYFLWPNLQSPAERRPDAPRKPRRQESEILPGELSEGGPYPGSFEGELFSRDSQGNVVDEEGVPRRATAPLRSILQKWLPGGGRFAITPTRNYVIKLERSQGGQSQITWCGSAPSPPFEPDPTPAIADIPLSVGDLYPYTTVGGRRYSVLQRDPRLIALKAGRSVRFVVAPDKLEDPAKADRLRAIIVTLRSVYASGRHINKVLVTATGDIVYQIDGLSYFAGKAPEGPEGFRFEDPPPANKRPA